MEGECYVNRASTRRGSVLVCFPWDLPLLSSFLPLCIMCMLKAARGKERLFGYVFLVFFVVESAFVWQVFAIGFFCCSNMGES